MERNISVGDMVTDGYAAGSGGARRASAMERLVRRVSAAVLWAAALVAAACTDSDFSEAGPSEGEALVRITAGVPEPAVPRGAAAPAAPAAETENAIAAAKVLVFELRDGVYAYRYSADGRLVSSSGGVTVFEACLTATSAPVKLMIAANCGAAFEGYAPEAGSDDASVRAQLGMPFAASPAALPMYGETILASGLSGDGRNDVSVRMLRAVARVDVQKELTAESRPFELESVYVYRAAAKLRVAHDAVASWDAPRVEAPSVFPDAGRLAGPLKAAAAEADPAAIEGLYVPEAESVADAAARLSEAVCVVVGGYYDGAAEPSYYRVDFDSGVEGHPFGQILRNHKYVFRITEVLGTGWSDPDSAAENAATGIVAHVEAWEDFTTEIHFEGDNYIGISSREVTLDYTAGNSLRVDVQSTVPYTVQWLDDAGTPSGTAISDAGGTSVYGGFSMTSERDAEDGAEVSHLRFEALAANMSGSDKTARARVAGGRWTFDITVRQENPTKYKNRVINVLSIHEIGSLGTGTPSTASGLALRRILDNPKNFSPDGTVVIGGFSFTELSQSEIQSTGTGSAADKEIFRSVQRTINAQDVIYLTYNTSISNELAQTVLSWLRGAADRVLIVGTDTDATNMKLRQYLASDGTWKYYYRNNIGGALKRAAQTDANARFFATPFGQVAQNAPFVRVDDYAGYCSDYPSSVAPLVTSAAAGYGGTMIVGVNTADRIVYHGDANLN